MRLEADERLDIVCSWNGPGDAESLSEALCGWLRRMAGRVATGEQISASRNSHLSEHILVGNQMVNSGVIFKNSGDVGYYVGRG